MLQQEKQQKQNELAEKLRQAEERESERQRKNEEKSQFVEFKKNELDQEPAEGTPGACVIKFRQPNSNQSFTRRFMKDDPISKAYDYVFSKLDEIEMDEDHHMQFELATTVPRKVLKDQAATFEQENLSPTGVLIICDVEESESD